ncbi:MAG: NAD(P)H-dependent oxidoreductase subunit E [Spirochaetes bacterium]|nr:NAD(P)H-dependent oxidoreductase subunit E [Spirochaetota bacterium]
MNNILNILQKYEKDKENILFALHDIQDSKKEKYLSFEDLQEVAKYFNIPLSKVKGVVTFYSMFSLEKRGKYIIRVCESAPCHVRGTINVLKSFKKYLGIDIGETTSDGLFTLETTSCLGVCGVAPACMINETVYGNLEDNKIKEIIENYKKNK